MAHPVTLVEKSKKLRHAGYSIGEISEKISVPKTTVSFWCRNIRMNKNALAAIEKRRAQKTTRLLLSYSEKMREERLAREVSARAQARHDIGILSTRDWLLLGLGLYWGEGYKHSNGEFGFVNSDPHMIQAYVSFLTKVLHVKKNHLIVRVSVNAIHKQREAEIKHFWSRTVGVSLSAFTKTSFVHTAPKKIYTVGTKKYYGMLRIKVRRGKKLKDYVLGALEAIR